MSALRRSMKLDLALMKKRARLARSIEKKRKKKGGRGPSAGSGRGPAWRAWTRRAMRRLSGR